MFHVLHDLPPNAGAIREPLLPPVHAGNLNHCIGPRINIELIKHDNEIGRLAGL